MEKIKTKLLQMYESLICKWNVEFGMTPIASQHDIATRLVRFQQFLIHKSYKNIQNTNNS